MSLMDYSRFGSLPERLSGSIKRGNISHAYIIEGDSCVDKLGFVKNIIKAILCEEAPGIGCDFCPSCRKVDHDNYEDLYVIEAGENSLKDEQVSDLQEKLKKKPAEGKRNLAVICDADSMTPRAQNRILKTLEEPNEGTVIFLLSENTENLIQTIMSRCIVYRLGNFVADLEDVNLDTPRNLMNMVLGGEYFYEIKEFLTKNVKDRKAALGLLDGMERLFREFLIMDGPCPIREEKVLENVLYVEEARRDILANVNYKYAIRNFVLKIGG